MKYSLLFDLLSCFKAKQSLYFILFYFRARLFISSFSGRLSFTHFFLFSLPAFLTAYPFFLWSLQANYLLFQGLEPLLELWLAFAKCLFLRSYGCKRLGFFPLLGLEEQYIKDFELYGHWLLEILCTTELCFRNI